MDGMAILHGNRPPRPAGYALVEVVIELCLSAAAAARRSLAAYWRARQMERVRNEMYALSDHYLRDIGLSRNEIDHIFR